MADSICRKYNFKGIKVATWRDPYSAYQPRSATVAADAYQKPYIPKYRYIIPDPKIPQTTDDEESSDEEEQPAASVDEVAGPVEAAKAPDPSPAEPAASQPELPAESSTIETAVVEVIAAIKEPSTQDPAAEKSTEPEPDKPAADPGQESTAPAIPPVDNNAPIPPPNDLLKTLGIATAKGLPTTSTDSSDPIIATPDVSSEKEEVTVVPEPGVIDVQPASEPTPVVDVQIQPEPEPAEPIPISTPAIEASTPLSAQVDNVIVVEEVSEISATVVEPSNQDNASPAAPEDLVVAEVADLQQADDLQVVEVVNEAGNDVAGDNLAIVSTEPIGEKMTKDIVDATAPKLDIDLDALLDAAISPVAVLESGHADAVIDVPQTPVADNISLHSDDKHVSFAPDTPEPKPTKRKKKTATKDGKKTKRRSSSTAADTSLDALADLISKDMPESDVSPIEPPHVASEAIEKGVTDIIPVPPAPPTQDDTPAMETVLPADDLPAEAADDVAIVIVDDTAKPSSVAEAKSDPPADSSSKSDKSSSKKPANTKSSAKSLGFFAASALLVRPSKSKSSKSSSSKKEEKKAADKDYSKVSAEKSKTKDQTSKEKDKKKGSKKDGSAAAKDKTVPEQVSEATIASTEPAVGVPTPEAVLAEPIVDAPASTAISAVPMIDVLAESPVDEVEQPEQPPDMLAEPVKSILPVETEATVNDMQETAVDVIPPSAEPIAADTAATVVQEVSDTEPQQAASTLPASDHFSEHDATEDALTSEPAANEVDAPFENTTTDSQSLDALLDNLDLSTPAEPVVTPPQIAEATESVAYEVLPSIAIVDDVGGDATADDIAADKQADDHITSHVTAVEALENDETPLDASASVNAAIVEVVPEVVETADTAEVTSSANEEKIDMTVKSHGPTLPDNVDVEHLLVAGKHTDLVSTAGQDHDHTPDDGLNDLSKATDDPDLNRLDMPDNQAPEPDSLNGDTEAADTANEHREESEDDRLGIVPPQSNKLEDDQADMQISQALHSDIEASQPTKTLTDINIKRKPDENHHALQDPEVAVDTGQNKLAIQESPALEPVEPTTDTTTFMEKGDPVVAAQSELVEQDLDAGSTQYTAEELPSDVLPADDSVTEAASIDDQERATLAEPSAAGKLLPEDVANYTATPDTQEESSLTEQTAAVVVEAHPIPRSTHDDLQLEQLSLAATIVASTDSAAKDEQPSPFDGSVITPIVVTIRPDSASRSLLHARRSPPPSPTLSRDDRHRSHRTHRRLSRDIQPAESVLSSHREHRRGSPPADEERRRRRRARRDEENQKHVRKEEEDGRRARKEVDDRRRTRREDQGHRHDKTKLEDRPRRERRYSDRPSTRDSESQPFIPQLLRSLTGSSSSRQGLSIMTDNPTYRSVEIPSPRRRRDSVLSKKPSPDVPEGVIIEEVAPSERGTEIHSQEERRHRRRHHSERTSEDPERRPRESRRHRDAEKQATGSRGFEQGNKPSNSARDIEGDSVRSRQSQDRDDGSRRSQQLRGEAESSRRTRIGPDTERKSRRSYDRRDDGNEKHRRRRDRIDTQDEAPTKKPGLLGSIFRR